MPFDINSARPVQGGFNINSARQVKGGFDISTAKPVEQQPEQEPMTLGGLGRNIKRDFGENVQGLASLAKGAITAVPKAGAAIGKDIAQTYQENKSIMEPGRGLKAVAEKLTYPVRHPIEYAKQAIQPVAQLGAGLNEAAVQAIKHPIRTAYENPVSTALIAAPPALKVGGRIAKPFTKAGKIQKAGKLSKEATQVYRDMLRPTQGEVKKIEILGKKNIDDYYKLAAKEKLPIQMTADKKLNTIKARELLSNKSDELYEQLNTALANNKGKIDLKSIATKSKDSLKSQITNATELKTALKQVDTYLKDEIKLRGRLVSAVDANKIKQGMWKVSYNQLQPNSKKVARNIGHTIKEQIEMIVPETNIKNLNKLSGDYLTLTKLLEGAQGRVIKGGRLGEYFARSIGAGVGGAIGSAAPFPLNLGGIPAGAGIGQSLGRKALAALNSPERVSRLGAKKMLQSERLFGSALRKK